MRHTVVVSRLLVAIVHELDADHIVDVFRTSGHRVTRIDSLGGFLGIANATLLIGVENGIEEEAVLSILEAETSARDMEVPAVVLGRLADELPASVRYGGATVFVIDLARTVRLPRTG
jgi:uncharacterized protein YaaQ